MLQHRGKKKNARAYKHLFIELDIDPHAAGEADAMIRDHACKMALAIERNDSRDLLFKRRLICKVVQAENFLQCSAAVLNQRQIVQRKVRNEAPLQTLPHGRPECIRWLLE